MTVCFPYDIDENWSVMQNIKIKISPKKIETLKNVIKENTGVDMYMLDDINDQNKIVKQIISYFCN